MYCTTYCAQVSALNETESGKSLLYIFLQLTDNDDDNDDNVFAILCHANGGFVVKIKINPRSLVCNELVCMSTHGVSG